MVKTRFPFFGNCWEEDDTFGRNLLGLAVMPIKKDDPN